MEECISAFRSPKKITRDVKYSPKCKFNGNQSPKSLSSALNKPTDPLTPQRSKMEQKNEIIPETPPRNFATEIQNQNIMETPRKNRTENKQITPLKSISKAISLSRLHRRKSLSMIETNEMSPERKENTLKRYARDQLMKPTKLFKLDTSKARSLFQEEKNETSNLNLNNFSLNTKSFYNSNKMKFERPFSNLKSNDIKRRRSLPPQSNGRRSLTLKKRKFGKINTGVFHGIKKPKPKANTETLKKEGRQNLAVSSKNLSMEEAQLMEANVTEERVLSPMIDENKRFFKYNNNTVATVTVNDKIKLKVVDGKIALKENEKRILSINANRQKPKIMNVSLDATDLTVDEPEVEATLQEDKVADLLKILEDDWANDDYDTMGSLARISNAFSSKPVISLSQNAIPSPATELNNITSMNIKDVTPLNNFENLSFDNMNNSNGIERKIDEKDTEKKYYPLFKKGYSVPENIFEELTNTDITKATKKNLQWQLSTKGGGANDQYQLDAGQKRFGATQCPECNIVYQLGDPEDENSHLNYHNSIRILKFQGWKNERVIFEDSFTSSRIILVEPTDPKQHWKKVLEILAVVDRDLGLADMNVLDYQSKKVFLYIREKNVLGVLVAEHIEMAYRMIPELIELNCCTTESTPTKCGINVVWTAMSHRKQGIATKLVDILRAKFFYGYVMSLDDIAFSIPTPGGKIFAEKYTKTKNFKVYN